MFIYDDKISGRINSDKIYRIETRYFKDNDGKKRTETLGIGRDGESLGKLSDLDSALLSFVPCAPGYEIVNVYFDDKTQTTFSDTSPVIGWGELVNGGLVPVGFDLEPAHDISNGRWGLRVIGTEKITVPYLCSHDNLADFEAETKKEFLAKIK